MKKCENNKRTIRNQDSVERDTTIWNIDVITRSLCNRRGKLEYGIKLKLIRRWKQGYSKHESLVEVVYDLWMYQ